MGVRRGFYFSKGKRGGVSKKYRIFLIADMGLRDKKE